jgi:hypothetical protein
MTTCHTCKHFNPDAALPTCNWVPSEPFPLWVEAVEHWMAESDIAEAEDECPAWQPRPAGSAA